MFSISHMLMSNMTSKFIYCLKIKKYGTSVTLAETSSVSLNTLMVIVSSKAPVN